MWPALGMGRFRARVISKRWASGEGEAKHCRSGGWAPPTTFAVGAASMNHQPYC